MSYQQRLTLAVLCVLPFASPVKSSESLTFAEDDVASLFFAEYYDSVDSDRSINSYHINAGIGYSPRENINFYWLATLANNKGYSIDGLAPVRSRMNDDSSGIGTSAMARWYFFRNDTFRLFVDASSGLIYFNQCFPSQGSRWNFYHKAGLGVTYQLSKENHLELAYRQMHISNGKGPDSSNPAIDSEGISVGLAFKF